MASLAALNQPANHNHPHLSDGELAEISRGFETASAGRIIRWAVETFGSLDASFSESHAFELQVFKFDERPGR